METAEGTGLNASNMPGVPFAALHYVFYKCSFGFCYADYIDVWLLNMLKMFKGLSKLESKNGL